MWEVYQRYGKGMHSAGGGREVDDTVRNEYMKLQKDYNAIFEEKESAKEKLLESQTNWTLFSKDILSISKDLYKAIQAMQTGQEFAEDLLTNSKAQIDKYEAFLNSNQSVFAYQPSSEATPPNSEPQRPVVPRGSQLKSPSFGQQMASIEIPDTQGSVDYPGIDYKKVKQFLFTATDDLKLCALLQAIRWRITRNRKRSGRLAVMSEYVKEDLLGCNSNGYILERLLLHSNKK